MSGKKNFSKTAWAVLACLVVPMFASFYFDDIFSTLSHLFENPALIELAWDSADYGLYTSAYSVLCVFGGLVFCGMLIDKWGVRITGSIFLAMMVGGASMVLWALAMGLQLSISRLGTACALVASPLLVAAKAPGEIYTLAETARPAVLGLGIMAVGVILWAFFVVLDRRYDTTQKLYTAEGVPGSRQEEPFRMKDVLKLLSNKQFLYISLLCVFFYSSIVAFKKFASAILIPRFDVPVEAASWMISMLPFATVIFAPLFGILLDKIGKASHLMVLGAVLAMLAHILFAFAPQGVPFYGYLSMVFLGFAYTLVPTALWPSVPKIVPENVLGTAYSFVYWIQNLGLMSFKMIAGWILAGAVASGNGPSDAAAGAFRVELVFVAICIVALVLAIFFRREAEKHPELRIDSPS